MDSESKNLHRCHFCGKNYKTKKILISHVRGLHGELRLQKDHKCHLCDSAFYIKSLLKRHISGVHQGLRNHKCDLCGKSYKQSNKLSYHMKTWHLKIKEHKCDSCDKSFTNKENLTIHQQNVHEGIKSFECDSCDKAYGRPLSLKAHIQSVHEGIKPQHYCKICDKHFALKQNLKSHFINCHTEREPHHCILCNKVFTLSSTLKVHVQEVHEGKKDHSCDFCDKYYTRKFELKKHMRKIHEGGNNGKIECDICGIKFMTMAHLRTHYGKIHQKGENIVWIPAEIKNGSEKINGHGMIIQEFECKNEFCGAKFKSTEDLFVHNATTEHLEETDFHNSDSTFHENFDKKSTITIIKEFECKFCGAKFKSTGDLFVHNAAEHLGETDTSTTEDIDSQFHENFDKKQTIIGDDPTTMSVSVKQEPQEFFPDENNKNPEDDDVKPSLEKLKNHGKTQIKTENTTIPNVEKSNIATPKVAESSKFKVKIAKKLMFNCLKCRKTFDSQIKIAIHMKKNHNRYIFKCKICDRSYKTQDGLDFHNDLQHPKVSKPKVVLGSGTRKTKKDIQTLPEIRQSKPKNSISTPIKTEKSILVMGSGTRKPSSKTLFTKPDNPISTQNITRKSIPPSSPKIQIFECNKCDKRFKSQNRLNFHNEAQHPKALFTPDDLSKNVPIHQIRT